MADTHYIEKPGDFIRYRAEPVSQTRSHLVQFTILVQGIKFLVDTHLFSLHVDITVRNERDLISLDGTILHVRIIDILAGKSYFESKFVHRLRQNLLISFVSHIGDISALFSPEKIAGTTDIQILHGDIETAAQVGELLDSLEPASGIL